MSSKSAEQLRTLFQAIGHDRICSALADVVSDMLEEEQELEAGLSAKLQNAYQLEKLSKVLFMLDELEQLAHDANWERKPERIPNQEILRAFGKLSEAERLDKEAKKSCAT